MNLKEAFENKEDWNKMCERKFNSLHTIFSHLDMWYSGYKTIIKDANTIIIKLPRRTIVRTGLLSNILSLEKSLKVNYMDFDIKWVGREITITTFSFLKNLRIDKI